MLVFLSFTWEYIFIILLIKRCLLQGLALSSIGEYKKAEEAHLKSLQIDRNFLEAWAHLTQVSIKYQPYYTDSCWLC